MPKAGCSPETEKKIEAFIKADSAFKDTWEQFEQKHSQELERIEQLREERNARLDEVRRSIRDDIQESDIATRALKSGPFTATKRWQSFYVPEKLVAKLEDKGMLDIAFSERIVARKIEVEKFDIVFQFLERHGLIKEFEDCEDGREMSAAVGGPKPIAPLGTELKE
jgi:hypothetical protein